MVPYQLLWLRGRQSFQPLRVQYQPLLLCQLLWLRRRQSFQSLRVQYQPSLLCQILMVRCQLLWVRGRQSLPSPQPQPLAPDHQFLAQQRRLVLDPQ
jgi:hypothetical protein